MKKKHYSLKNNENIIFFPGMIDKLIEDGLAFAEENNYMKATECFDEAKKYVELDDMILSIYILALLETRRQQEAKEICEDLMKKRSPMFEQIVELYLTILLDLKEYGEVDKVLNRLLVDKRFPNDRKQNFLQLKELSGKLAKEQESLLDTDQSFTPDNEKFNINEFTKLSVEEQERLLQESFFRDVTDVIPSIRDIAENSSIYPAIRSLALLVLGAIGETTEVEIEKFGYKAKVNPVNPPTPNAVDRIESINQQVHEFLEKDPSKFEMTIGLVHSHAYALFPFDWVGYSDQEVAKGYVDFVESLFGNGNGQKDELSNLIKRLEDSSVIVEEE
ncbi:DUF3196 family protein [Bacillus sp. Cr_A10]|uniref:DUF3196 family protein n=1 Tax=Bacillus sp. Cr_A10 TaxID=3033993 RepID=UPI0023DBEF1F|nr:DUF3196 family protein [Bacillus sp. Cr_A10]MDF2066179.1 hypothetical protein [Bacillus sp. Cr_A10]